MNIEKTIKNLKQKGYEVTYIKDKNEAIKYLKNLINNSTVRFGDSQTLNDLNLKDVLSINNIVYSPNKPEPNETFHSTARKAMQTQYYILSANGLSENGEIVNMDHVGNRLAGSLYGHKKVYYIIGTNKICSNLEETIYKTRNIACPKNALRFKRDTACVFYTKKKLTTEYGEQILDNIDKMNIDDYKKFVEKLDFEKMGIHCFDCRSNRSICSSLLIHLSKLSGMDIEIVLIDEDLGF